MAGRAFGHDYKMEWLENERLRQENSTENWIYIGVDTQRPNMAKIGLTTGSLGTRASGSQNPFYTLLCAFKIKDGVHPKRVAAIEDSVKDLLSKLYSCIPHETSGRKSEWFYVSPLKMRELVYDFLYQNFNLEMHCYHCNERDIGVIYSWENSKLLQGTSRPPYQANDLSDPPVDPNCFMPGGCGEDCDCWD
ncbi:GIY-YIG nuclease family protein [Bacterioplanoides sp. SCSIO 12839]|uniref:GIY-YIG nuclease family protein n=1 Tax=Bacterioplanoides sp. SCSIO 12839 TaxID=2829569 RepID=UPI0021040AAD|nr:GIY-YIG nuclease family protein [Bacterioplanoides sp. SCSIO 12839]UTW48074.1 GIY-YIG nuclease family protein [Bacterioplanoides sp. SCSIO 12839]